MYLGFNSMYRGTPQTTASQEGFNEFESKYKVAEILSSMQSSSGLTPTVIGGSSYVTSTGSGFTPILTPTTLANIEQTFINLQQSSPAPSNLSRESGFVPPVVVNEPNSQMPVMVQVKSELDYDTDYSSVGSESEYGAPSAKRGRYSEKGKLNIPDIDPNTYLVANSRRPTGPRKIKREEKLTPEEEEKRSQRRERNKLAAAKCRKRREDVTNTLIVETETLEEEKNHLENEILKLRQQKEQFEFLLEAHKNTCQYKHQQPLNLAPPKTTATMTALQAAEINRKPVMTSNTGLIMSSARPTTLPIGLSMASNISTAAVTESLGIPITTPSTGMFGFDAMAEGHTGLTPLTGIASSSIATPTSQSCSGQVQTAQRRSTDSSSSNDLSSPTTLMAL